MQMSKQTAGIIIAIIGTLGSIALGIINRTSPPPAPKQEETLAKEFYSLSREAAQKHGSALGTLIPEVIDAAKKLAMLEEHSKGQDKTLDELKDEIKALREEQTKLLARLSPRGGNRPVARPVDHDGDGVVEEPAAPAPAPPPEPPAELKALETWKPQELPTVEQLTRDPAFLQRTRMAE